MSGRVRLAVLGTGRMGRIHATSLAASAVAELACVVDADAERARAEGERLGVPWSTDPGAVLGSVDGVVVATPTATHADLVAAAAGADTPVFCEKPVSLDRAATVAALDAVRAAGVALQVGFHRRFDPDWVAVHERIAAGELGDPYLFRTSLRDMRPPPVDFLAGSGGFFLDVTIHDLDTARWLVGEVAEVVARGSGLSDPDGYARIGDVDTAVVLLRFAGGALGVIDGSRCAGYGYECATEVMGSRATARIDTPPVHRYTWLTPGRATTDLPRDFEQRYPRAYALELDAFAAAVRDRTPPRVSGEDALAAFDLAVAADRSARTGAPVPVRPDPAGGYALDG